MYKFLSIDGSGVGREVVGCDVVGISVGTKLIEGPSVVGTGVGTRVNVGPGDGTELVGGDVGNASPKVGV